MKTLLALLLAAPCLAWQPYDDVSALCAEFDGFDHDTDGDAEITRLAPLGEGFAARCEPAGGLVLVLIEPRLANPGDGPDLRPSLATYIEDLAAEGWDAVALEAGVYAGPRHQDGRTLLALREFLRAVAAKQPSLQAVILVGAYPDAFLVRQYAWWKHEPLTLNRGKPDEQAFEEAVDFLRSMPEPVAHRCDLVLGDLDGAWENLYHRDAEELPYQILAFPQGRDAAGEGAAGIEQGTVGFVDFFLVNDGRLTLTTLDNGQVAATPALPVNEELAPADAAAGNPIAIPEVWVSRLDARNASVQPDPAVRGAGGEGLLDADGRPQAVTFAAPDQVPHPHSFWLRDEPSERAMLADWSDRRHRYRLGQFAEQFVPASMDTGWGSALPALRESFPEWAEFDAGGYDIVRGDVRLDELVDWLKLPAVARALKAHGDPWGCAWARAADPAALDEACGPVIYNWAREGTVLRPTLAQTSGKLDFAVTRSLYESGRVPDAPAVWLYTSCEGTMPQHGASEPYTHPRYGFWQGSECILFHLHGLALVGRSKVFYDEPREFWAQLGAGQTIGAAWRRYFVVEAADERLDEDNGIGCKRSYFWNVLGDCTVRLVRRG